MRRLRKRTFSVAHFRKRQCEGMEWREGLDEGQKEITCLNCHHTFTGHYCPYCGQKATVKRITVKDTLHHIFTAVIAGDSTFFITCRDLLWRPGHLVRDYLLGNRARYFHPFSLLVQLVACYVILAYVIGLNPHEVKLLSDDVAMQHVHSKSLLKALDFLSDLMSNSVAQALISSFLSVMPIKWMYSKCTILRNDGTRSSLNVAEHFYTLIYNACLDFICTVAIEIAVFMGLDSKYMLMGLLDIILPTWIYRQIFGLSWWGSLWRSVLAYIIICTLLITSVILLFGITYGIDAVR